MGSTHEGSTSNRVIIALLMIAALVPFAQTLSFGYVMDDTTAIRANPAVTGWTSLIKVWTQPYFGFRDSGLYRPLSMTVFALIWNAGGRWPLWFHVLVVAMHMAATVMVWRLLAPRLDRWPAVIAATWFAVHPVHVEAVANIANSTEIFVALWICALAQWLSRIDERPGPIPWTSAVVAGALYLAAFLSKESGAVAPLLAALWLWGWRTQGSAPAERGPSQWLARWWPVLVAWGAAALIVFTVRGLVLGGPLSEESIAAPGLYGVSAGQRIWAMLSLGPTILRLLIWPGATNPHYGPTALSQPAADVWAAATIVMAAVMVVAAAWLAKRGDRRLLASVGWTAIAFVPASNIFVATGQILSERTLYVPSIGVAMIIGLTLQAVWSVSTTVIRERAVRIGVIALAACVVTVLALRTVRSSQVWRNHNTLFTQMIAADTAGYRGYWLSALDARRRGDTTEALALFGRAYSNYPRDPGLLMDYSISLFERHEYARAASIASRLMEWSQLRAHPTWAPLYLDALGRAYGADSVIAAGRRLMAEAPSAKTALFVGSAHEVRGDFAAAIRSYRAGLQLAPADSTLRDRLAKAQRAR